MYSQKDIHLAELALKSSANWTKEDHAYIEQEMRKMKPKKEQEKG